MAASRGSSNLIKFTMLTIRGLVAFFAGLSPPPFVNELITTARTEHAATVLIQYNFCLITCAKIAAYLNLDGFDVLYLIAIRYL
jgi:hypothetical protein